MEKENLNVSHLVWCSLIALLIASRDGVVTSPAQANLFLIRWLATAEKQRRFGRALVSNGNLHAQNDLFRLQHALHAVKLTGWTYTMLAAGEWCDRQQLRLNACVSGIYLNRNVLDAGSDDHGRQRIPLPALITGEIEGLDVLLSRAGCRREQMTGCTICWQRASVPRKASCVCLPAE